jgi:hypothetical protein
MNTPNMQTVNPAYKGKLGALMTLIRREIWCHSSSYRLPLIILISTAVLSLLLLVLPSSIHWGFDENVVVSTNRGHIQSVDTQYSNELLLDSLLSDASGTTEPASKQPSYELIMDIDAEAEVGEEAFKGEVSTKALLSFFASMPESVRISSLQVALMSNIAFLLLIMSIALAFLLGKITTQENRDGSLFFWKSMPVSDTMEITARALFILVLLPLIMWATAILSSLLILTIFSIPAFFFGLSPIESFWTPAPLLSTFIMVGKNLAYQVLMFAPTVAFFFAAHTWRPLQKGAVALPLVLAFVVDWLWFGGGHVWDAIFPHLIPPGTPLFSHFFESMPVGSLPFTLSHEVWPGLVFASFFFATAVFLRRRRDEV